MDTTRPLLGQEHILGIALERLKVGDDSHTWALVLEIYHILGSRGDVDGTPTQLFQIVAAEVSDDIAETWSSVGFLGIGSASTATAQHAHTGDAATQVYVRIWVNFRIVHFTLKPIRRPMDETRHIVVAISAVEQSRIGWKNLFCLIWKRRVLIWPFEGLKTMLNEPMVYD